MKFAISYKASGRKIKKILLNDILKDEFKKKKIEEFISKTKYRNIDDLIEEVIYDKPVASIVIIDECTSDLENVLSNLTMKIDILEFKTYVNGDEKTHQFTPFQEDIIEESENICDEIDLDDLDTIVVPANEEGFNEVFLGEDCWYSIRISSSMIDRIKYIAGYQTAPVSAVTYYAEVSKIEKYKDTGKYILYFKDKAKKIEPIKLGEKGKGKAPQSSRYTTFNKLMNARTIKELF